MTHPSPGLFFGLTTIQMYGILRAGTIMERLTGRQKDIVDYITRVNAETGGAPTIRDIARSFAVAIGTAQDHIAALVRKGYLTRTPGAARGLALSFRASLLPVPLVGSVHAGTLTEAIEVSGERVYVDSAVLKGAPHFALRVKGDSMTGAGIYEGDVIVVRQQRTAENGDIVAAMVDGEAAVKRLRRRNGATLLESANPRYKPIVSDTIVILGKVVYLTRKL